MKSYIKALVLAIGMLIPASVYGQSGSETLNTPGDLTNSSRRCADWTYLSPPAAPVDHFLMANTSGSDLTIVSLDCIVIVATSVALDVEACDEDGSNCATTGLTATCTTAGVQDTTPTSATLTDTRRWKMNYGATIGSPTSLTYQICYTQGGV